MRKARIPAWLILGGLLGGLACAKQNPSSPAIPPGQPVALRHLQIVENDAREIIANGYVRNQSGFRIYSVRIGLVAYRDAPFYANFTDTSGIVVATVAHGDSAKFATRFKGDRLVDIYPVWSYLPP